MSSILSDLPPPVRTCMNRVNGCDYRGATTYKFNLTPIGEMVSLLVWDQGAQVRFLHRRPVFWAVSANGNTSGLQPEIESSILSRSTKLWAISKMNITQGYEP